MSTSVATVTPGNLELSPMRVTYNGVDLGATLDSVKIHTKIATAALHADQLGSTIIDHKVSGYEISIVTSLAETQLKANWKVIFPYAKYTSSSTGLVYFDSEIGDNALSHAAVLLLHPLSKSNADLSGDYTFYKVTAIPDSEITYSPSGQAKLKVTFHVYPDFNSSPVRFFVYGDPSIGLVAASASGSTYSGTGNGVMSAISAGSTAASELITIKCVGAVTNAGNFSVIGSVTGIIGIATVGVGFSSSKINFSIADGSTDFIVNDQFTITTVSANYS